MFNEMNVHFCSIQEHFKTSNKRDMFFKDKFDKFNINVIPGYRPVGQDTGRASGGLAQLNRCDIAIKKDRVVTRNYRIQAPI